MKKIVRGKNGGRRPGAGRKVTGRNTVTIAFSVHKDHKEIIRQTVFDKVNELKAAENKPLLPKDRGTAPTETVVKTKGLKAAAKGLPLPKDYVEFKKITAVDGAGKTVKITPTKKPFISDAIRKKTGLK